MDKLLFFSALSACDADIMDGVFICCHSLWEVLSSLPLGTIIAMQFSLFFLRSSFVVGSCLYLVYLSVVWRSAHLLVFINLFVSRISFCNNSMRSFNCSCVGSMSLIRTLLYVATPIGVLIPRNDHCTSTLFISEQIS